jgi:hypothetical protein
MATENPVSESTNPRPWMGWLKGMGWAAVILVILAVLGLMWNQHMMAGKLQETLAQLDHDEPGWRWEAIEAARDELPEDRNSADVIVAAAQLLPQPWPTTEFAAVDSHRLLPNEMLDEEYLARLRTELASARPALKIAARLADLPRGRYQIHLARNPYATPLPHVQESRTIVNLFAYESMRQNQRGDSTKALRACRAALNAGRSVGDAPFCIVQLVRTAGVIHACQAIERTLGQGEPAPEDLAGLQELLKEEDAFPSLLVATRGERASMHRQFEALERGEVSLDELLTVNGQVKGAHWVERTAISLWRIDTREDHALYLSWITRRVKEVQQPLHQQAELEKAFEYEVRALPRNAFITRFLLPAVAKMGEADRRKHAHIRCTLLALAAERFRRDKKTWPDGVDQLRSHYLATALLDPFDGKPLRYRRVEDGVVIYSVGADTVDNGGNLDREGANQPGVDLGVRLWDADKRRQPPRPKPPVLKAK